MVEIDHPHPDMVDLDHSHPDMIPVDHYHPPQTITEVTHTGIDEGTGEYDISAVLLENDCDERLPGETIELDTMLVAVTVDNHYFIGNGLFMTSGDGILFLQSDGPLYDFWTGCSYTNDFEATLSFTSTTLSGPLDVYETPDNSTCIDPAYELTPCSLKWELSGTKL
jgi:hypothetical protein